MLFNKSTGEFPVQVFFCFSLRPGGSFRDERPSFHVSLSFKGLIKFRLNRISLFKFILTPLTGLTFYKHPLGSQNIAAESVYQKSQLPWTGIWNEYSRQCVQSTHTWKINCKVFKWKSLNGTTNAALWYESCRRDLNVKCSSLLGQMREVRASYTLTSAVTNQPKTIWRCFLSDF